MPRLSKKSTVATTQSNPNLQSAAHAAYTGLQQINESLALDNDLTAKQRKVAAGFQYLTTDAITTAIEILGEEGRAARFPMFNLGEATSVVDYETDLGKVADAAESLAVKVRTSILKRRQTTVSQLVALHASMKAVSRHDGTLSEPVAKLAPFVRTRAPSKKKKPANGATSTSIAAKKKTATSEAAVATGSASAHSTAAPAEVQPTTAPAAAQATAAPAEVKPGTP